MYPKANTHNEKVSVFVKNCHSKVLTKIRSNLAGNWGHSETGRDSTTTLVVCDSESESFRCEVVRLLTPSLFCRILLNKLCCRLYVHACDTTVSHWQKCQENETPFNYKIPLGKPLMSFSDNFFLFLILRTLKMVFLTLNANLILSFLLFSSVWGLEQSAGSCYLTDCVRFETNYKLSAALKSK